MKYVNLQSVISKIILSWMILGTILLGTTTNNKKFFSFGPSEHLILFGITIDTLLKYFGVILFCFTNSIMRTFAHTILHPWLVTQIQDETNTQSQHTVLAYEITSVNSLYGWFDLFVYMNIVFSQFDMIMIEMIADVIVSSGTTTYYLYKKRRAVSEDEEERAAIALRAV